MTIFIPQELKVGYQKRDDTFTGKLAYVNYKNVKGEWSLDKSWKSWIDASQGLLELKNEPLSGYIVNKSQTRYSSFSGRSTMIRIYHPNGFEFEITPDNLCAILSHSDISHSYISQECIVAFEAGKIILVPTNSAVYQKAIQETQRKHSKLTEALEVGAIYVTNTTDKSSCIYLGQHNISLTTSISNVRTTKFGFNIPSKNKKTAVFWNQNQSKFVSLKSTQIWKQEGNVEQDYVSTLVQKLQEQTLFQDTSKRFNFTKIENLSSDEKLKMISYSLIKNIFIDNTTPLIKDSTGYAQIISVFEKYIQEGTFIAHDKTLGLSVFKKPSAYRYKPPKESINSSSTNEGIIILPSNVKPEFSQIHDFYTYRIPQLKTYGISFFGLYVHIKQDKSFSAYDISSTLASENTVFETLHIHLSSALAKHPFFQNLYSSKRENVSPKLIIELIHIFAKITQEIQKSLPYHQNGFQNTELYEFPHFDNTYNELSKFSL